MHQSDSVLRTSICSDDKGNIYIANSNKKVVSILKESEDDVEVVHTPGAVALYGVVQHHQPPLGGTLQ